MFVACESERDSIRLRVLGGDWGPSTDFGSKRLQAGTRMFVLQTIPNQLSFIWLLAQSVGGSTFLCGAAEYSRC